MKGLLSLLFVGITICLNGQNTTSISWNDAMYGLIDNMPIMDSTTFNNSDSTVLATLRWSVDSSGLGTFVPHSSFPDYVYYEDESFGGMVGSINMGFDNSIIDSNDAVIMSLTFSQGVNGADFEGLNGLSFSLLDVDQNNNSASQDWDDNVEVYYNGINAQSFGLLGSCNSLDNESYIIGFEGGATATDTENCNASISEISGNIGFEFLNILVTNITIVYRTGKDITASNDPESQRIGISNLSWTTAPLPVELVAFEGYYKDESNEAMLEWETAAEINSDYFEIQMSSDGLNWSGVGQVSGQGNKTESTKYQFAKAGLEPGLYYFRLKQVDFDGQFDFSDIIVIDIQPLSTKDELAIFPNPFDGTLFVSSNSEIQSLEIFNYQGQMVYKHSVKGDNSISLNLEEFLPGFYAAKVGTTSGSYSKMIVKQ